MTSTITGTMADPEGVLFRDEATLGPIRLPAKHQAQFVQQFNQLYQAYGIRLVPVDPQPDEEPLKPSEPSAD
ncbi:hypothetical protein SV7mr_21690 [Stieleria bergensis]|uniref:Uncharacterized protein n=1 Tax=Stieleria bergensis TaxID=2528025 RepID=A0A517SU76_9BACT|nr:hypothetical protein SV7mr_21690 [Planctomycetes bacterium SV_7m_r]